MREQRQRCLAILIVILPLLLIAACGGGGDDAAKTTPTVTASTTSSGPITGIFIEADGLTGTDTEKIKAAIATAEATGSISGNVFDLSGSGVTEVRQ